LAVAATAPRYDREETVTFYEQSENSMSERAALRLVRSNQALQDTSIVPSDQVHQASSESALKSSAVHPKIMQRPRVSLEPLQEWEGYVTQIGRETFFARLLDKSAHREFEDETVEFLVSDLSEDNAKLLREGAIFRWVIGYYRSAAGTKKRVSEIVFRRLPALTKRDLIRARLEAKELTQSRD
jgi:hypothetical protein